MAGIPNFHWSVLRGELYMKRFIFAVLGLCLLSGVTGCGSGGESGAIVRWVSPANDSTFTKGAAIPYEISTQNFNLRIPPSYMHHMSHNVLTRSGDHGDEEIDPTATEGHYHIYLDDAEGSDPHLTQWGTTGAFQLADDISSGTHSLRIELRNNDHLRVGIPGSEAILFFDVE